MGLSLKTRCGMISSHQNKRTGHPTAGPSRSVPSSSSPETGVRGGRLCRQVHEATASRMTSSITARARGRWGRVLRRRSVGPRPAEARFLGGTARGRSFTNGATSAQGWRGELPWWWGWRLRSVGPNVAAGIRGRRGRGSQAARASGASSPGGVARVRRWQG